MTKKELTKKLNNLDTRINLYKTIVGNAEKVIKLIYDCDHSGIDIFNDEIKKIDNRFEVENNHLVFKHELMDSFKFRCNIIPTSELTTLDASKTSSSFIHNCCELQYKIGQLESTKDIYDLIIDKVENLKKENNKKSLDNYLDILPTDFKEAFELKK